MSNHLHGIFRITRSEEDVSLEEVADRYNSFKQLVGDFEMTVAKNKGFLKKQRKRMLDLSQFMRDAQQEASVKYNLAHNRKGGLWQARFHSTILKGGKACWDALAYIALNPVRANMVFSPEEYEHCGLGQYKKTGKHPYQKNFVKCLKEYELYRIKTFSDKKVIEKFYEHIIMSLLRKKKGAKDTTIVQCVAALRESNDYEGTLLERDSTWVKGRLIGEEEDLLQESEKIRTHLQAKAPKSFQGNSQRKSGWEGEISKNNKETEKRKGCSFTYKRPLKLVRTASITKGGVLVAFNNVQASCDEPACTAPG